MTGRPPSRGGPAVPLKVSFMPRRFNRRPCESLLSLCAMCKGRNGGLYCSFSAGMERRCGQVRQNLLFKIDDLQVAYDRVLDQYLSKKVFSTATGESFDSLDTFQDMSQVNAWIFRHNGLASLRMRRRSNQ